MIPSAIRNNDISVAVLLKQEIHISRLFFLFFLTHQHTHTHTDADADIQHGMSMFSHCISFSPFSLCCAPVSLHWTLTRGGMMEQFSTHTQTHTLIHRRGFSSALLRDRVVCLVLIEAIQPNQHGGRAETERERLRVFFICLPGETCSLQDFGHKKENGSDSVSQVVNRYFLVIPV